MKDEGEGSQNAQAGRDAYVVNREIIINAPHSGQATDASVSGSQGVQVGTGNTQVNNWPSTAPLDPVLLSHLHPHAALARLRPRSHDELVDFFAAASPSVVSEILSAFLEADGATVIAILADVNPRKAMELIKSASPHSRRLEMLPTAADAIAKQASELKWVPAGNLEGGPAIYQRRYKNGRIFWTRAFGAHALGGAIEEYYSRSTLPLGFPTEDQEPSLRSAYGVNGASQNFVGYTTYSSKHGIYSVPFHIGECYAGEGGVVGWLGFPIEEVEDYLFSLAIQRFEGGVIYVNEDSVHPARRAVLEAVGYEWFPVSREAAVPVSPYATVGTSQEFQDASGGRLVVYSSNIGGAQAVSGRALDHYVASGATSSWLGFPLKSMRPSLLRGHAFVQQFEGGCIYDSPEAEPVGVPAATVDLITRDPAVMERLGWASSEDRPAATGDGDRIQFFEGGVVTLRRGKREVWLRP